MELLKGKFEGLSSQQVEESMAKHGANIIDEKAPPTLLEEFKNGFEDPMIKLLCAVAVVMIVFWLLSITGLVPGIEVDIYGAIGIVLTVCAVNLLMAKTTLSSDSAYRELKNSIKKDEVKVYRDGKVKVITVDEVVVGDIVILQSGDKVPADGLMVWGSARVNNSALNGETEECKKFAVDEIVPFPENLSGDTVVDRQTMFSGSIIYDGDALMLVQKVGMQTMMGKMAGDEEEEVDSPLKVKLGMLANKISKFGYTGAAVISLAYLIHFVMKAGGFGAWLDMGVFTVINNIVQAAMVAVMIIVCAVPEGLPLMISLVLMQNTGRLLKHNCLVRKAIGIETAGSLNILFSDKTGTITKGQLEVVETFDCAGEMFNQKSLGLEEINIAICRNTGSMFDDNHNVVGGNLTDQALVKFTGEDVFKSLGNDVRYTITDAQDFNSTNKFSQARLGEIGRTYYKGAPEKLLAKAKKYLASDGEVKDIDRSVIDNKINELAERAMRVLAFGYSEQELVENEINDDLVIVGFTGIRDDVRPEAKEAIHEVKQAGIQVVMITGDRLETAVSIARDADLLSDNSLVITKDNIKELSENMNNVEDVAITSEALNGLDDNAVKRIMGKIRVVARALPTDKSRMVKLCQELQLVCGMTGDGRRLCPVL